MKKKKRIEPTHQIIVRLKTINDLHIGRKKNYQERKRVENKEETEKNRYVRSTQIRMMLPQTNPFKYI